MACACASSVEAQRQLHLGAQMQRGGQPSTDALLAAVGDRRGGQFVRGRVIGHQVAVDRGHQLVHEPDVGQASGPYESVQGASRAGQIARQEVGGQGQDRQMGCADADLHHEGCVVGAEGRVDGVGQQRRELVGAVGRDRVRAVGQDPGGPARAAVAELDHGAYPGEVRRHPRVPQRQWHLVGESAAPFVLACLARLLRGGDQAAGVPVRIGGQTGGPLVRRGRGRHRLPASGPLGDPFQLRGDLFVRAGRRGGQVPGAPVRVLGAVQVRRQRPVCRDPPGQRGLLVGGEPDEGVPETQLLRGDEDQSGTLGGLQIPDFPVEPPAAASTVGRSPVSSAAATASVRWVASGSRLICCANPSWS